MSFCSEKQYSNTTKLQNQELKRWGMPELKIFWATGEMPN